MAEAVAPDSRAIARPRRGLERVKRGAVLELGSLLVICTCMVLMRFGV